VIVKKEEWCWKEKGRRRTPQFPNNTFSREAVSYDAERKRKEEKRLPSEKGGRKEGDA